MSHKKIKISVGEESEVTAVAPVIITASRSTDIPAFYADWFFNRLLNGYVQWRNPFNGKYSYVSFAETRFVVFWSKNPKPLIPYLKKLRNFNMGFYIQFSLNDYETEKLEPGVPSLDERIDTFKRIIDQYGLGSVIWRFDPLILTDKITSSHLLEKIDIIAEKLNGYTEKLIFSFADIDTYRSVSRNLNLADVNYHEWAVDEMKSFAATLSELNKNKMNLELATCAETVDLKQYDIAHGRCVDPVLIARLSPNDIMLQRFLFNAKTDKGQRKSCGCILSKDIGAYNTCPHLCKYCYANYSPTSVMNNFVKHNKNRLSESLI